MTSHIVTLYCNSHCHSHCHYGGGDDYRGIYELQSSSEIATTAYQHSELVYRPNARLAASVRALNAILSLTKQSQLNILPKCKDVRAKQ